jgi:hypothetical protein
MILRGPKRKLRLGVLPGGHEMFENQMPPAPASSLLDVALDEGEEVWMS